MPVCSVQNRDTKDAGAAANYTGDGFAKMKFAALALPAADFDTWAASIKAASSTLALADYQALAEPSTMGPAQYASVESNLFDSVIKQFMDARSPIHH
mgnify:CR=1 FL=1